MGHQSSEISSLKKREKFCLFFGVTKNLQRKYFWWGYLWNTVGCFLGDFKLEISSCLDIFNLLAGTKTMYRNP